MASVLVGWFPNDIGELERMSEQSRDLRDQAMLEFDAITYNGRFGNGESNYGFVQKLMSGLNRHLPNGFELVLHPTGTDFESR